ITGVRAEQQAINERALMDLSARAERLGIPTVPSGLRSPDGLPLSADVKFRSQASVNAEIMGLLARIAAATEKANERHPPRAKPPPGAPAAPAGGPHVSRARKPIDSTKQTGIASGMGGPLATLIRASIAGPVNAAINPRIGIKAPLMATSNIDEVCRWLSEFA